MPNFWIQTPPDSALADMRGWAKIGPDKYAAVRHHLLVVPRAGGAKNGPIHRQMDWPTSTKFVMQDKIVNVASYTYSIQESITSSITTKLSQEVLAKVGSSSSIGLNKVEASLGSELQSNVLTELVQALQTSLSTTSTYSVQTTTEKSEAIEFVLPPKDGSIGTRRLFIFFKLRQLFWEVYLVRTDYLELEYKQNWLWPDVRETIVQREIPVNQPLFRIEYYEPYSDFSFAFDNYQSEVENGDAVTSTSLTSPCPSALLKPAHSMEQIAKVAFPVSRVEKKTAKETKERYTVHGSASRVGNAEKSQGGTKRDPSSQGEGGANSPPRSAGAKSDATSGRGSTNRSSGTDKAGSANTSAGRSSKPPHNNSSGREINPAKSTRNGSESGKPGTGTNSSNKNSASGGGKTSQTRTGARGGGASSGSKGGGSGASR